MLGFALSQGLENPKRSRHMDSRGATVTEDAGILADTEEPYLSREQSEIFEALKEKTWRQVMNGS